MMTVVVIMILVVMVSGGDGDVTDVIRDDDGRGWWRWGRTAN